MSGVPLFKLKQMKWTCDIISFRLSKANADLSNYNALHHPFSLWCIIYFNFMLDIEKVGSYQNRSFTDYVLTFADILGRSSPISEVQLQ